MLGGDLCFAAAQPNTPNPPWPARCPLRLGLVVDQSSSMAQRFGDVREAARNVVDSLRDKHSEVSIIGFDADAEVVARAVDVSDDDARHDLKDRIDELEANAGAGGATNWEAALVAARSLDPDVVILVTDGFPTVYGDPVREGEEAVAAAAAAADQLKNDGTRVSAVGVDLATGAEENLRTITGPARGNDYYTTDTTGLLRRLYEIVANSCGVSVAALPRPEPPEFPLARTILGSLAGLALLTFVAFLFRRRRGAATGARGPARGGRAVVADQRIDHGHLTRQLRGDRNPPSTKDQS
ncbi:vWA domain-containing protein [Actinophytocola oryzae]|nr:vWA domain-containing protein [Actinophytocola oryzae]